MSPSVNKPLSSRAALVPAMLVGAAVALLAIPSAAASDGPGEWLLTGLENRWKWGADWTPEFGPWAWLVFADRPRPKPGSGNWASPSPAAQLPRSVSTLWRRLLGVRGVSRVRV